MSAVDDYSDYVAKNWRRRRLDETNEWTANDLRDLFIMTVGAGGENGEVQELLKKFVRDGELDEVDLLLELGDAIHYLVKIGHRFGLSLPLILTANMAKLDRRASLGKDYQAEYSAAYELLQHQGEPT